ncbi:MAG: LysM peptidoglycan-binding domain-containing protein [Thermoleophilia bacterium]|nr:LysM peptidoglycan-binding domain-containing protein [Thermoleophilia bacterium]
MPRSDSRRLVAPAAFLLAATIAVLLIRSGLEAGKPTPTTTAVVAPPTPHKKVRTTKKTTKRTATTSGPRFWTVQAGDTFGVISSKTGVPVATIQQLNPNVKSTSLFIGEKLRLR